MPVSLITNFNEVVFSSDLRNVLINAEGDNELEFIVKLEDNMIFSTTHQPFNGMVVVNNVSELVEFYMRRYQLACANVQFVTKQNYTETTVANLTVVYLEQRFMGDTVRFLEENFLTSIKHKLTSKENVELLHFFANDEDTGTIAVKATKTNHDIANVSLSVPVTAGKISSFAVSYEKICNAIGNNVDILAAEITVGQRKFNLYFSDETPNRNFMFANQFNCFESLMVAGETTHIPSVNRNTAVVNRKAVFYGQVNEEENQVECADMNYEQAKWMEQMIFAQDVRCGNSEFPLALPKVLITEYECKVSDADDKLNSIKFNYKFDELTPLFVTNATGSQSCRIFNEIFNQSFN